MPSIVVVTWATRVISPKQSGLSYGIELTSNTEVWEMGLGKHRDDGTGSLLGTLNKRPWENESITEVQPIMDVETLPLGPDGREISQGSCEPKTK